MPNNHLYLVHAKKRQRIADAPGVTEARSFFFTESAAKSWGEAWDPNRYRVTMCRYVKDAWPEKKR